MLQEGYAAVATRRVAKEVELTPALVHYYFPTTEDLLIAVYRRAVEQALERLKSAFASEQPLRATWKFSVDPTWTTLAMEFMAMANHRKAIRAEIASSGEYFRQLQAEALSQLQFDGEHELWNPLAITILLAGISRLSVAEGALGIALGHREGHELAEYLIQRLEAPQPPTRKSRSRKASRKR